MEVVISIIYFKDFLNDIGGTTNFNFNTSVTLSFKFLWWIVKKLSFLSSSLKGEFIILINNS